MTISSSTGIFVLSLLAIPICFVVNAAQVFHGETGLLISGSASLFLLCFFTYKLVARKSGQTDPLFYVFALGTFASVVDLIIGLENDGLIHGFMTQYLKDGEPYLKTAYGTMISYWDGTAHYAMYLMMLAAFAWNQSFREVGLYWAGSIGHSMIVYMPGNVVGKHAIRPSFLLNVPYMIIPFFGMARFLRERPAQTEEQPASAPRRVWRRPLDLLLILGLVLSMAIALFRGFAVLGLKHEYATEYLHTYEPYLKDDNRYPEIQMLVYLFYFVPYYALAVYGLVYGGQRWMPDWALIHAGAAAQAQFSHIGAAFHARTPYILRVSPDPHIRSVFLLLNGFLLLLPQLLAYRCHSSPELFQEITEGSRHQNGRKEKGH